MEERWSGGPEGGISEFPTPTNMKMDELLYDHNLIENRGMRRYFVHPTKKESIYLMHSTYSNLRTRRVLFDLERGRCFWCKTVMPWNKRVLYPDSPTVDHFFSKRDPRRKIAANDRLCVLACYNCNTARARLEEEMMKSDKVLSKYNIGPLSVDGDVPDL